MTGKINMSSFPEAKDYEFTEEVDWMDIDDNGEIKKEEVPETLADKQALDRRKEVANITVYDEKPEFFYAKAFVAINRNNPEELKVLSPFGGGLDKWFETVINSQRVNNQQFEEDLQLFLEEKKATLADRYAFNNRWSVPVFEQYPQLCNNTKYRDTKKSIEDVAKDVERIRSGEDETSNFSKNMRVALDSIFREAVKSSQQISILKKKCSNYYQYEQIIKELGLQYNLGTEITKKFCNKDIYNNMVRQRPNSGGAKDCMALLLLDAYYNNHGSSERLLTNYPEIFMDIIAFINRGNKASHGATGYSKISFGLHEVEEAYTKLEEIISIIYEYYLEGVE